MRSFLLLDFYSETMINCFSCSFRSHGCNTDPMEIFSTLEARLSSPLMSLIRPIVQFHGFSEKLRPPLSLQLPGARKEFCRKAAGFLGKKNHKIFLRCVISFSERLNFRDVSSFTFRDPLFSLKTKSRNLARSWLKTSINNIHLKSRTWRILWKSLEERIEKRGKSGYLSNVSRRK